MVEPQNGFECQDAKVGHFVQQKSDSGRFSELLRNNARFLQNSLPRLPSYRAFVIFSLCSDIMIGEIPDFLIRDARQQCF